MSCRSGSARSLRRALVSGCIALMLVAGGHHGASAAPETDVAAPGEVSWVAETSPVPLALDTAGGVAVVSKDDYVRGTVRVAGTTHPMQIKGRGNSTWTWPKKPYRIKLDDAASLLGLPSERDWVLLANYADRAGLRNHLALRLAGQLRMGWSPRTRFVDVSLNGEPQGLYLLAEQVERSAARVPGDRWLLEVDERYAANGDPGFRTQHGIPIAYNDPDDLAEAEQQQVKDAVSALESALYGSDFADPVKGYAAHVDIGSFVDWYLVNELFKSVDSDFYSSVMLTWKPGGRFAMGPAWDFDLSAGFDSFVGPTVKDPHGWWTRPGGEESLHPAHQDHWIARMFEDPRFMELVAARWEQLRPLIDSMVIQVPDAAAVIEAAALDDWSMWHTDAQQVSGGVHSSSFEGEVHFLQEWLRDRVEWLDFQDVVSFSATDIRAEEDAGVLQVPVTYAGNATGPVTVSYAASGSATSGADHTVTTGTLSFAPGESTASIPVTILDDPHVEGPESVRLELSSPSTGTLLGSAKAATITIAASDQQPDATIRAAGARTFAGDGVYNVTAERQTRVVSARRGRTRTWQVRVGNDGNVRNAFVLRTHATPPGARVAYFRGRTDITRAVRSSAGYRMVSPPGKSQTVTVRVTVLRAARVGTTKPIRLRATWQGDGVRSDVVKGVVRVVR